MEHFDVYITEVLVSVKKNVIPFTHPSRSGLTPQKTYNDFFFFKANKTRKKGGGWGGQKSILADLLSISNIASCIFFGGNPLRMQNK